MSGSVKRKSAFVIEYAPAPEVPDADLALKVSLMQELKKTQDRTLELIAPLKEELEQLKTKANDIREKLKSLNLDIQMKKIQEQQSKLQKK